MTPCLCQRDRKALPSSRGRSLPMTGSSHRPSPSPSRSRRSHSRQSRSLCSLESQRRSLESPRSLESRLRSRESRLRSLESHLRSHVHSRSRPRSLEKRVVCVTASFRGRLCRRDGTSPG